jgi:thioredoxin 1
MLPYVKESDFAALLKSDVPLLVDFGASWCAPCQAMDPVIEDVARSLSGRLRVVKVDVDQSPALAARYGIRSMPTLIVFKGGEPADVKVGAGRPGSQIIKWLESHL